MAAVAAGVVAAVSMAAPVVEVRAVVLAAEASAAAMVAEDMGTVTAIGAVGDMVMASG
jgi:hypothetical protein